jgi:5-formyltetrahydrofolate cyclo-ligase
MPYDVSDKPSLRAEAALRRTSVADRDARSRQICERLAALDLYRRARALHCYLAMRTEVSTLPLIAQALGDGLRVAVPITVRGQAELSHSWLRSLGDLERGTFGIPQPRTLEPCDPAECDLLIVPLLGFDRRCHRLGYGKGHYDRLLASLRAPRVGVAFAAQELPHIPVDPWDVALDAVVTEDEVVVGASPVFAQL